ncbi:MAG: DUF302 domain-containing protein [Betaproteobacteria bacterium]
MRWMCVAFSLLAAGGTWAACDPVAELTAHGSFEDVKQMLVLAIENRGLVVNHQSNVGEMLLRTGNDLGASKQIYVRAEVLEFCSATLSRKVMEADHRLLAFCPYGIGIYVLPGEAERVHLVYRKLGTTAGVPASDALLKVDQLLHEIVQEAAQ